MGFVLVFQDPPFRCIMDVDKKENHGDDKGLCWIKRLDRLCRATFVVLSLTCPVKWSRWECNGELPFRWLVKVFFHGTTFRRGWSWWHDVTPSDLVHTWRCSGRKRHVWDYFTRLDMLSFPVVPSRCVSPLVIQSCRHEHKLSSSCTDSQTQTQ